MATLEAPPRPNVELHSGPFVTEPFFDFSRDAGHGWSSNRIDRAGSRHRRRISSRICFLHDDLLYRASRAGDRNITAGLGFELRSNRSRRLLIHGLSWTVLEGPEGSPGGIKYEMSLLRSP